MKVAVIGAGSWGTAVSWLLDGKGYAVQLWAREPEIAQVVNTQHRNPVYLKDLSFTDRVTATADIAEALDGVDAVVMVTPSVGVRSTAEAMAPHLGVDVPVIILSKGVEPGTSMLMTDILYEVLGNPSRVAALSGPNHAEEVGRGVPSATVIASESEETAAFFQDLFGTPFFRVYTNTDVTGVELCGAGKNIVAIASGISDGLGYGDNTKASIMTRGLAEMARIGEAVGADPMTYLGLAGVGDLIATCTSQHSRNRALGEHLAHGGTLEEYEERTKMVAEGAAACRSIHEIAQKRGIDAPFTELVYRILYEGFPVSEATAELMGRPQRTER